MSLSATSWTINIKYLLREIMKFLRVLMQDIRRYPCLFSPFLFSFFKNAEYIYSIYISSLIIEIPPRSHHSSNSSCPHWRERQCGIVHSSHYTLLRHFTEVGSACEYRWLRSTYRVITNHSLITPLCVRTVPQWIHFRTCVYMYWIRICYNCIEHWMYSKQTGWN